MLEKLHEENENTLKEREELQKKLSAAESEAGKLRESEAALKEHEKNLLQVSAVGNVP
jgi:septation ring formation regulator EzrA